MFDNEKTTCEPVDETPEDTVEEEELIASEDADSETAEEAVSDTEEEAVSDTAEEAVSEIDEEYTTAEETVPVLEAMVVDDESSIALSAESPYYTAAAAETAIVATQEASGEATSKKNPYKLAFRILIGVIIALAALVGFALATAETKTFVDVPSYERPTGVFNVTNGSESPCYVNQSWTDCINRLVGEYNAACANRRLSDAAYRLCSDYSDSIDWMKERDYAYVVSLGSIGHLTATEIYETVPAVTHEGTCYLGFIGECE